MRPSFRDREDQPVFELAAAPKTRRGVSRPGRPHYGRVNPDIIATDGPSKPTPRYQRCTKDCGCRRCLVEAELDAHFWDANELWRALPSQSGARESRGVNRPVPRPRLPRAS